jgi:hypothetical protein
MSCFITQRHTQLGIRSKDRTALGTNTATFTVDLGTTYADVSRLELVNLLIPDLDADDLVFVYLMELSGGYTPQDLTLLTTGQLTTLLQHHTPLAKVVLRRSSRTRVEYENILEHNVRNFPTLTSVGPTVTLACVSPTNGGLLNFGYENVAFLLEITQESLPTDAAER